jgi:hypothetical protein
LERRGRGDPGQGKFKLTGNNVDASIMISREGQWKLQLRATCNTLNWGESGGFASANNTVTTFGRISSFRAARRMRLAAKINF